MADLYISDLVTKNEEELNALKKKDIIECLIKKRWQWETREKHAESLKKEMQTALSFIKGFLGEQEMPDDLIEAMGMFIAEVRKNG